MLTPLYICIQLKSSTLVPDLWLNVMGIILILYRTMELHLLFQMYSFLNPPFIYLEKSLTKHYIIYDYFKSSASSLDSRGQIFYYGRALYYNWVTLAFAGVLISNFAVHLSGEIYHGHISIGPDYNLSAYYQLLNELQTLYS